MMYFAPGGEAGYELNVAGKISLELAFVAKAFLVGNPVNLDLFAFRTVL
jgi:hypothetical protein